MQIDFNSSPRSSLGVEWELMLVDTETRDLANEATPILAEVAGGRSEHPKAKHELFENTIEIITGVCGTAAEVRDDLLGTLRELHAPLRQRGLAFACAGTHPFADWSRQIVSPNPRYHALVEQMQWAARRLLIFGVHVHVGVRGPEKCIAMTNALCAYIPHLLGLSASSPYWRGYATGLASTRSKIFEGLPTAGLPYQLSNWGEFEQYMHSLITAEAIRSIREVWWDIRPHPNFGTVEVRICDGMPTLNEVAAAAALAQCLVQRFDELLDAGERLYTPAPWLVRENKWLAVRYGLDAVVVDADGRRVQVREALLGLADELRPVAARLGCKAELGRIGAIVAGGASYERQRAVVDAGGTMPDVVDSLVAELVADTGLTAGASG